MKAHGRSSSRPAAPDRNPRAGKRVIAPPPRIAGATAAILRALPGRGGPSAREIALQWPQIVGERTARLCRPLRLAGRGPRGVLHLAAAGPAAVLVEADAARILDALNAYCGAPTAGRVAITRAPRKRASGATAARGLPPSQEAALAESLDSIADPRLKSALTRLGRGLQARANHDAAGATTER